MNNKLAIISVIYQNYLVLGDFFTSLRHQNNKNFHVFISDNSPKKHEVNTQSVPSTIIPSANLGYAHGINLGIKEAIRQGYNLFCTINNDIYFKENLIGSVLKSSKKYPNSIITGKIYYAKGYEYHKDRYKKEDLGKILWYAGGYVDWDHALNKHRGVDQLDEGQYNHPEETDFISGCLMVFNKHVVEKIGFLDEKYFLYFEDADYDERAKRNGIKLLYDPSIVIWHKVSQSTGGSGSFLQRKYQEKNRVIFGLKYAPFRTKVHLVRNYAFAFVKNLFTSR